MRQSHDYEGYKIKSVSSVDKTETSVSQCQCCSGGGLLYPFYTRFKAETASNTIPFRAAHTYVGNIMELTQSKQMSVKE